MELLIATVIFVIMLTVAYSIFGQSVKVWKQTEDATKAFQSSRVGFDLVTRNLSQATLNTYLDYLDTGNRFPSDAGYSPPPARYGRRSDLQFVCGRVGTGKIPGTPNAGSGIFFLMPAGFEGSSAGTLQYKGLDQLLNACGYYVKFGDDTTRPGFVATSTKYRYRLMQLFAPTQKNQIFFKDSQTNMKWFSDFAATDSYPVAENVVALVGIPVDPEHPLELETLTKDYSYDSRANERVNPQPITANQMPPVIKVTMVAIDEASAIRLENGSNEPAVIRNALAGKFQQVKDYEDDLHNLEKSLIAARIQYRTFNGSVAIRESKWSK